MCANGHINEDSHLFGGVRQPHANAADAQLRWPIAETCRRDATQ